jgi:MFS family permease
VLAVPALRTVVLMNLAVGLLFMGSFQVGIPLLVRDVFNAGAAELAALNAVHVVGAVVTMVSLLRYGDVLHPGRLLLLGVLLGVGGLSGMGLSPSFAWVLFFNFCWGVTGGMVMAMARALMQEGAPEGQRGRVMAFFTLTFMGAGPLGALLSGYLVESLGPRLALITPAGVMLLVILGAIARSPLWAYHRGAVPTGP